MHVKIVTLILTKRCNLRCNYCYVRYENSKSMSLETAQTIIAKEMAQANDDTTLVFSFLGGEPFCEFETLKEICEWIWSRYWNTTYYINAVTNGTLLTDEIRLWLIRNHHRFYLTLSYDGIVKAQNQNRYNSASIVDIDFFHEYWPQIPFKMTITEGNISNLYDNIIYLHQKGILVNDTFADNTAVWKKESLELLDQQLSKLSSYYLLHHDIKPSDLLNIDLIPVLDSSKRSLFDCGAGKDKVTYDTDGTEYLCHLLSPLALDSEQLQNLRDDINNSKLSSKCHTCILDPICPFCPGMSYLSKYTCWIREDKNCSLFKHQVYYACSYQLKTILRKKRYSECLDDHDKLTYISIKYILNNMNLE